jgi:hypothetical protein
MTAALEMDRRELLLSGVLLVAGCSSWAPEPAPPMAALPVAKLENPLFLASYDRDFLWNELAATIEQFGFRIEREERVRQIGDVLIEGRLETYPVDSPTVFEPWRRGATAGYERWESTLQSIRRRASVRVLPATGGYLVEVIVLKELEDVSRPEQSSVGEATFRHDGTLVRPTEITSPGGAVTLGWIPQGRDIGLEQEILVALQARIGETVTPLIVAP